MLFRLLTLPVTGVIWVAEQVAAEAEREWTDPDRIRRELAALHAAYEAGEVDDETFARAEDELLDRLELAVHEEGSGEHER